MERFKEEDNEGIFKYVSCFMINAYTVVLYLGCTVCEKAWCVCQDDNVDQWSMMVLQVIKNDNNLQCFIFGVVCEDCMERETG